MNRKKNITADFHYYSDRSKDKLHLLPAFSSAVVEAPSGYGKTTAVQDYLETAIPHNTRVYWFTAADEAPVAGYRRLCREIEKIDAKAGERLLEIDFPNAFTIGEVCEALLSVECDRDTWLVIDNFHFLCAALPPSFLTALIGHGGKALRVVILTQMLPRATHCAIAGRAFLHIESSDLSLSPEDIRRYYALTGTNLTKEESRKAESLTGGWIIAVYLQLYAYRETGAFSDTVVWGLMERLWWNKLTDEQQNFFLRLSPFGSVAVRQMCDLLGCDTLPDYAVDCLSIPFIRYDYRQRRYEQHDILLELTAQKRSERGVAFETECFSAAGDLCRREGRIAEALVFYARVDDYERILSLDFSLFIFQEVGSVAFSEITLKIARSCPKEILKRYPLSALRVAWAIRLIEKDAEFGVLMDGLDGQLKQDDPLMAEWLLLSAYRHYPHTDKMLSLVREAEPLFGGNCSRVILPDAPWAFGGCLQMCEFHMKEGEADREADALGEFISIYSRLTNGHGCGADALFRAELAYFRGDMTNAEIFAYKATFLAEGKRQSIIQLGAAVTLSNTAVFKGDTASWKRAVDSMERAASGANPNTPLLRAVLDTIRGMLLVELGAGARIADWLKEGAFSTPMSSSAIYVLYVHALFLIHQGNFARLIGTLEAVPEIETRSAYVGFVYWLLLAVGYCSAGDREKAAALLERAAKKALPDGLVLHFAAFSWLLQGLAEELIETKYPHIFEAVSALKEPFGTGWTILRDAMFKDKPPSGLTAREREIALLAAEGLRNGEIARRLFVTENTVHAHLRTIFQKLDIDRRAKLAEKLK